MTETTKGIKKITPAKGEKKRPPKIDEQALDNSNKSKDADANFRDIQYQMSVSKDLNNKYGGFKYYNLEMILTKLKPLLKQYKARLEMKTQPMLVGNYLYQNATVKYIDPRFEIETSYASREDERKKGMDAPQTSGSAASYAKKGALANLFLIDDGSEDPDSNAYKANEQKPVKQNSKPVQQTRSTLKHYTNDELTRAQVLYQGKKTNIYNVYTLVLNDKAQGHDKAREWWKNWYTQPNTPQGNLIRQFTAFYEKIQEAKQKVQKGK